MSLIGSRNSFTGMLQNNRTRKNYGAKMPNKDINKPMLKKFNNSLPKFKGRKINIHRNGKVFLVSNLGNELITEKHKWYSNIMGIINQYIKKIKISDATKKNHNYDSFSDDDDNPYPIKTPLSYSNSASYIRTTVPATTTTGTIGTTVPINKNKVIYTREQVLAHFSEHKMMAEIILMKESFELLVGELQNECVSLITFINSIISDNSQSGGVVGTCRNHQKSLEYQKPDTLHYFSKDRNRVFPFPFNGVNFYNEIMYTIFNNYIINDKFEKYYKDGINLGSFEDKIKNDYLTSFNFGGDDTCEPPYNKCSFYFTQKDEVLNKDLNRYSHNEKIYDTDFTKDFKKYVTQGYNYYVIDACMSVQNDEVFNEMTRLDSLCTLFDPVGLTKFDSAKINNLDGKTGIFIDNNPEYNLKQVKEFNFASGVPNPPQGSDPQNGDIYDCKFIDDRPKTEREDEDEGIYSTTTDSFYDLAYNHLLNVNTLEKYGIIFKLRLCYVDDVGFKVCICVYTEPPPPLDTDRPIQRRTADPIGTLTLEYVCTPNQSFPLHELALGMAYVHFLEKGSDTRFGSIDTR